jgi:hypothetical protein
MAKILVVGRIPVRSALMCRNIKRLFNFDPPATKDEVRDASLQFLRKLSGFSHPSKTNEAAFKKAVNEVTEAVVRLLSSLKTSAPSHNQEGAAAAARRRSA